MSFGRTQTNLDIGFWTLLFSSLLLSQARAGPSSKWTDWINRIYRPQLSPQNWVSFAQGDLLGEAAHVGRDTYLPPTNTYQRPLQSGYRTLSPNVDLQYSNEDINSPQISTAGIGGISLENEDSVRGLRVPGLLEDVSGGGGSFPSRSRFRPPPLPDIQIGDPPPRSQLGPYRLEDNFQQSFQVLLMPQSNWATQNYRDVQGATFSDGIGGGGNEGSILTANRIYFSPPTPYARSMPFRRGRPLPPARRPTTGLSSEQQTNLLLHNISSVVQDRNIGVANADKTIAVVHLQSYSALPPDRMRIMNDSDIIEAQGQYGFPNNNFKFGSTHTIVSVFKKLLNTNFEGLQGRGADSAESISRIQNFVNATQKIHFWAHGQGEEDAQRLFQFTLRSNNGGQPTFTDTAPVTDTLSAVVF